MASVLADLWVTLIGNDTSLLAAAKRSSSALEGTAGAASKTTAQLASLGKGAAIALGAVATYSIESAAKFQQSMELIHTQAGASQAQVDSLSKSVLNLAGQVGQSPDKLAEGLYHIASAGAPASQWMDILTESAKEASIGIADMETVSNALVGVMMTAPKDIHSAAEATSFLNQTVGIGNMKMSDLVSAIGTGVLPAFKSAQLGMKDFSASLATLTDLGEPANQAATRLRTTVSLMAAPSGKAADALKKIGISQDELAKDMAKPGGMLTALEDLRNHLKGLSEVQQNQILNQAFGGARSGSTIMALVENIPKLQQKYDQLGTSASRAKAQDEAWRATQQNFNQQRKEFTAGLQAMAITLGEKLLPPLTKFVGFLASHQQMMVTFFTILLIFLGLLTIAWIANAVAAAAAMWPLYLIIAVVALVAVGIYELVKHWNTVWSWIKRIAVDVWHALVDAWHATWNAIMDVVKWIEKYIIDPIVAYFELLLSFWTGVWHGFVAMLGWINSNIIMPVVHLFEGIVRGIVKVFDGVVAFFRKWWPLLLMIFAPPIAIMLAIWNHFHREIMAVVAMVWMAIKNMLSTIWDVIKTAAALVWEAIYWTVINPIVDAYHKLLEIWNDIVKSAEWWWDTLTKAAAIAWEYIYNIVVAPIARLVGDLASLWMKVWNVSTSFFQQLWNYISNIASNFYDIGKDIVMGIVHGIEDAAGWLYDEVKNLANNALKIAKNFIGAHSPSVLFEEEVGQWIPAGIAVGVNKNAGVVTSAITHAIAPANVSSAVGAAVGPVMAGGSGQQIVIESNLYIDGRQLQAAAIRQSQRYKVRNNSTGLT